MSVFLPGLAAKRMASHHLLWPQFAISLVSWLQLLLSMNRYRGLRRLSRADIWALLLLLHAALLRWVAAVAVRRGSMALQLTAAGVGACLAWIAFVVVFNESFLLPSRQQMGALLMSLVVTSLWEINGRLVVTLE